MLKDIFRRQDLTLSRNRLEELTWLGGGQIITVILSVVSVKLMTSVGSEEYGKLTLATSVGSILILGFFGPIEQAYTRFYFDYTSDVQRNAIFSRSLLHLLWKCIAVLVPISVLLMLVLDTVAGITPTFTIAAASMIILGLINVPLGGMLGAMRRRRQMAMIQVFERVAIILLLLWFLGALYPSAATLMIAIAVATALSAVARVVVYLKASPSPEGCHREDFDSSTFKRDIHKTILKYSLPFVLWGALAWVQGNGERWVISRLLSTGDVGRYGLAYGLVANSAALAFGIMAQYITPVVYQSFSSGTVEGRTRALDLIRLHAVATALVFGVVGAMLFFWGGFIIPLLSNADFVLDGGFLFLLTAGIGIFHMAQSLTAVGMALRKPEIYMRAKVVAAIASVVLYCVGCYLLGLVGIALAMIGVSLIYLVIVIQSNRRLMMSNPFGSAAT